MLTIVNPSTEQVLREVTEDSPEAVRKKYERARASQPGWAQTPLSERKEAISRFRNLLVERKDDIASTLTSETGKPLRQSLNEISATPERIDFFLADVDTRLSDNPVFRYPAQGADPPTLEECISYDPLGVVASISAWNMPYSLGSRVFIPALLAGNAVIYKPSEHATLSGLVIVDLMVKAGVPPDVLVAVTGSGSVVGAEVARLPVDALFFTGSYASGVAAAEAAAGQLSRTHLDLAGKDPVYVCEDVDVEAAAAALADGAFYNGGQSCCAVERLYVHTRVYESFTEAFVRSVQQFPVGDPTDLKTYIGPVARVEQLDVLDSQLQDAITKGAQVVCGGGRRDGPGYFFEPTVLTAVDHTMAVMRQESFGPLIGVQQVSDDDEAVQLLNDSEYGLTAGVYTKDRARAQRLLAAVDAGTVYWNCCDRVSPRLPWCGRKHSGAGATLSTEGILAFVKPKAWHLKAGP